MLKFLRRICLMAWALSPCVAHAGLMVNVEYIHQLIARDRGIEIKYNPGLSTPKVAANMKYLLTTVDVANQMLNGQKITDYGNGEYATMAAADTVATNEAVRRLITVRPKFTVTTTPDTKTFEFQMSARGRFVVDWGDGKSVVIKRDGGTLDTYSHTYATPGEYQIKMTGAATGYPHNDYSAAAISFEGNTNVARIDGSLGAIFGTIGDGTDESQRPRFFGTFKDCTNLAGTIPENLFAGIHGQPARYMFANLFSNCSKLSGSIPANLFSGLDGVPTVSVFAYVFSNCRSLSGPIPGNLFAGVKGAVSNYMFDNTFADCRNLSGPIPADLFAGVTGTAREAFTATFYNCGGLTGSIPENLFAGIKGEPKLRFFRGTFWGCTGLTGSIPPKLFAGISGAPADGMFAYTFNSCRGLTGEIPAELFAGINGAPAENMYNNTFNKCSGLTGSIPAGLFGTFTSVPEPGNTMFYEVFYACPGLTGCVPDGLFAGITDFSQIGKDYHAFAGGTGVTSVWCSVAEPKFWVTANIDDTDADSDTDANNFSFGMSAAGTFAVDWGDGETQYITRADTTYASYSHTYAEPGEYTIDIGGYATRYTLSSSPISFDGNTNVVGIDGSLGAVFPTIGDGSETGQQPVFYGTFRKNVNLSGEIPANLFEGVHGAPRTNMFRETFYMCKNLNGPLPAGLFGGLSGAPANKMFFSTFAYCYNLSGEIPADLFGDIYGAPANGMYADVFAGCRNLSGEIPARLFGNIYGPSASVMFHQAFNGCANLTGCVPDGLFGDVGMSLDEIISAEAPFGNSGITPSLCPAE